MIVRSFPGLQRSALFADELDIEKREAGKPARFVASTTTPARSDNSIIDQSSWILDDYARNSIVLRDHRYSTRDIVGRGTATVEGERLIVSVVWAPSEAGRECQALYEGGFLNAVSVGWMPGNVVPRGGYPKDHPFYGDRGVVYQNNRLWEMSLVAIGDDPDALADRPDGREAGAFELRGAHVSATAIAAALVADPEFLRAIGREINVSGALPGESAPGPQDLDALFATTLPGDGDSSTR